jgi:hypothetical protein
VDQGGRLERLAGGLVAIFLGRERAQLVVDQRQQVGGGAAIPSRGGVEQPCDVGHAHPV